MSKKSTKKTRPCLNSYVLEMTILFNMTFSGRRFGKLITKAGENLADVIDDIFTFIRQKYFAASNAVASAID